jgi:hypothetical protein
LHPLSHEQACKRKMVSRAVPVTEDGSMLHMYLQGSASRQNSGG